MGKHAASIHHKYRIVSIIMILQIFFFILCMTVFIHHLSVRTMESKEQKTERYKSVRICSGESLWEISGRFYSDEYKSMHLYIKKIMRLNNMSDEHINTGAYLIIPYYE